jgi:hypothetical protein
MHPDDPASGAAFTTEGHLDAHGPQEGLRPAQTAGERAWIFGPATVSRNAITAAIGAGPQKVGGAWSYPPEAGNTPRVQSSTFPLIPSNGIVLGPACADSEPLFPMLLAMLTVLTVFSVVARMLRVSPASLPPTNYGAGNNASVLPISP